MVCFTYNFRISSHRGFRCARSNQSGTNSANRKYLHKIYSHGKFTKQTFRWHYIRSSGSIVKDSILIKLFGFQVGKRGVITFYLIYIFFFTYQDLLKKRTRFFKVFQRTFFSFFFVTTIFSSVRINNKSPLSIRTITKTIKTI